MARVRVLTVIAERYDELVSPLNGPDGIRGDGLSPVQMPATYTATVREFERLVVRLRTEEWELWWHLRGWYLEAQSRTMFHCPRCGPTHAAEHVHPNRRSGRPSVVKCRRVVIFARSPGARESFAKVAIEWLAFEWGLGQEPMLPDEIRVA